MSAPTQVTKPNGNNLPAIPARAPTAVDTLHALLQRSKAQIALALPRHMTPERMIRVALTACHRSPALLECSPVSVLGCVIQAGELGLELTGPLGQAYMVPYWNKNTKQKEAQFQVGYRGLIKLAFNSSMVSYFNAHCVHENDAFEFNYGTSQRLKHTPSLTTRGDRKSVV